MEASNPYLAAEAVQGATLALQSVDDVHGGDGLPLGVLGVGNGVANDVLEEDFQHAASLLVDQAGDTLDTATTSQTTYRWLGDALDVISEHLAMALSASLSQSLASFTATRHVESRRRLCSNAKRMMTSARPGGAFIARAGPAEWQRGRYEFGV